jgi:hypothetical protein
MPYHPTQPRPAAWRIIGFALIVGLIVGTYLWSFRAGRSQMSEARERPPAPPAVTAPMVPEPPGRPVP